MKLPILVRSSITIPTDDAESFAGISMRSAVKTVDCTSDPKNHAHHIRRNLFGRMRVNSFRSKNDYTGAARRALGLDYSQSVVRDVELKCGLSNGSSSLVEIVDSEIEIICKHRPHEKYESVSLPSKLPSRNASFDCDSESSVMDGSCSNHSILDELRMQEYEDPYKEFVKIIASSKRIEEKIEEVETDVLTQLPSITKQFSQKQIRKKRARRYTINNSPISIQPTLSTRSSTCLNSTANSECYYIKQSESFSNTLETQSLSELNDNVHSSSTYQNLQPVRKHICDGDHMLKQKSSVSLAYNIDLGNKDISIHRLKVSKISSVASSSRSMDERMLRMLAQNGERQNVSVCKVPRQRRATIQTSTSGTYHGRIEL